MTNVGVDNFEITTANMDILRQGYLLFQKNPDAVICFRCYNKEEADWFNTAAKMWYPDMPVMVTWLDFDKKE